MGTSVEEVHQIAKKILGHLLKKQLHASEVQKLTVHDSASIAQTMTVFYWLRNKGYIQKTGCGYRDPYEITDKGRAFYDAI